MKTMITYLVMCLFCLKTYAQKYDSVYHKSDSSICIKVEKNKTKSKKQSQKKRETNEFLLKYANPIETNKVYNREIFNNPQKDIKDKDKWNLSEFVRDVILR